MATGFSKPGEVHHAGDSVLDCLPLWLAGTLIVVQLHLPFYWTALVAGITNGLDAAPTPPDNTVPRPESSPRQTFWRAVIAIVFSFVLYSIVVIVYGLPASVRTFVALSVAAGALVVGGLLTLIVVIPVVDLKSDVKTEFYSARAAYLCVIAGLALFAVITIGAIFVQVALALGKP